MTSTETELGRHIAQICTRAANGDIEARVLGIPTEQSDLQDIALSINRLLDVVDAYVRESGAAMDHCSRGLFYRPVLERGLPGAYAASARILNAAAVKMRDDTAALRRYESELRAINEGLEEQVAKRTAELKERNDAVQLILDNVTDGFVTLSLDGIMAGERSTILTTWFGVTAAPTPFWDYIAAHDPKASAMFRAGWSEIVEDVMPLELTIDQMPKQFVSGDRVFQLTYKPIMAGDTLHKMLLVVTDMTSFLERQKAEAVKEELMQIFAAIRKDKAGFLEFYSEAQDLVSNIHEDESLSYAELFRLVHTLKGNCGLYGVFSIATVCHQLETKMQEAQARLSKDDSQVLVDKWNVVSTTIGKLVGDTASGKIEINDEEYLAILRAIGRGAPRAEIVQRIAEWKLEPTEHRLARIADHARGLALRLGKGEIATQIVGNGLRIAPRNWAEFWGAFAHVVRNAIDHGLERPDDRRRANKHEHGTLTLSTHRTEAEFIIEIADDGGGIDWLKVGERAKAAGIPHQTHDDLVAALFCDGISTKDAVTDTSGRGVGMAAVRAAADSLHGRIEVRSERGHGTIVRFVFPVSAMVGRAMDSTVARSFATVPPVKST